MSAPNTSLVRSEPVVTSVELASVVPADFALTTMVERHATMLTAKMPPGYTLPGMLVELYNASRKQPELLKAHADELIPALCEAVETGGTIGRDVYLLTFFSQKKQRYEVAVALSYLFKAELVVRAGGARSIDAASVYSKEPFALELGTHPHVRHQPLSPQKRGALIGAYAVAQLGHGIVKVHWSPIEDVEAVRKTSKSWGPDKHKTPPDWYPAKHAVHRLVKLLPKNPKLTRILGKIDQENELEFGGDPDEIARVEAPAAAHAPASTAAFDGPAHITEEDPDPPAPEPKEVALDVALAMVVRGKRLEEYRTSALRDIGQWAADKCDEAGADSEYAKLVGACHAILRAREKGQLQEPAKKSAPADGGLA